jgi:acylphosphatase
MIKFKATTRLVTFSMVFSLLLISISFEAKAEAIQVFEKEKRIEMEGEISRELDRYADTLGGAMEYVAVSKGGKEYESIIVLDCKPADIYNALIKLGVEKGTPASFDENDKAIMPTGGPVRLFMKWKDKSGKTISLRPEDMIYNINAMQRMKYAHWPFVGSVMGYFDPESDDEVLQASVTNNIISLHHGDQSVIIQNPMKAGSAAKIPYRLRTRILEEQIEERKSKGAPEAVIERLSKQLASMPPAGTKVKLIIDADNSPAQIQVLVSGDVQGVGFRDFTMRNAKRLGLKGYAKNLENGKVEIVAEGPKFDLDKLIARVKRGPRTATVKGVEVENLKFTGKYKEFEVTD